MNDSAIQRFLMRLQASFDNGSFVKLTLGHPSVPESPLRKLLLRPVLLQGEKVCCVVSRFLTRDETKNRPFEEIRSLVESRLGSEFLSAHLFTESENVQLELGAKYRLRIVKADRGSASLEHDRCPARWVDTQARYLKELEVTDSRGKVRERMGDKFRQIERFVDLLASAFRESNLAGADRPVVMGDMGSGKGLPDVCGLRLFSTRGEGGGADHRRGIPRGLGEALQSRGTGLRFRRVAVCVQFHF